MQKMKAFKRALALAAVLVMAGTAWAKQGGGPGVPGNLNGARNEVTLEVSVPAFQASPQGVCDTANSNQTYSLKAYIFQPSGRMFAIGIGVSQEFDCSTSAVTPVPVIVNALQGLTFKPGPATLMYQVIQTTTDTTDPQNQKITDLVVYEAGSRIDLH